MHQPGLERTLSVSQIRELRRTHRGETVVNPNVKCELYLFSLYIERQVRPKSEKRRRNRSRVSRGGVCKSLFHVL